jgi:hypothetical protein
MENMWVLLNCPCSLIETFWPTWCKICRISDWHMLLPLDSWLVVWIDRVYGFWVIIWSTSKFRKIVFMCFENCSEQWTWNLFRSFINGVDFYIIIVSLVFDVHLFRYIAVSLLYWFVLNISILDRRAEYSTP